MSERYSCIVFFITGLILLGVIIVEASPEATIFTYRSSESEKDLRYEYDTNLLRLALESTLDTDGPYQLVASPQMNYARAHSYLEENTLPNFFIKLSYEPEFTEKNLAYVPFPIDLGIVGYRVCFAHPDVVETVKDIGTLNELRNFSHGQGKGWADVNLLRHNGFNVTVVPKYESLFIMVAKKRFDLFCRGANELLGEYSAYKQIKNLSYDESFTISYPFPRFFYTNAANRQALDRVTRGILKAYKNGSLQQLWREQYEESINFVNLGKRKVFSLENPNLQGLDFDFEQYFYDPFSTEQVTEEVR